MPRTRLDDIDLLLLDLLQHDAARPLHELGAAVGLSPSAVQRRITRYRRTGVLTGQVGVLDPAAICGVLLAVVLVTLINESAGEHHAFHRRMLAEPNVQQCYEVAGPWDYVVILACPGLTESRELADRLFRDDDNVRRFDTLLVNDAVKSGTSLPLPVADRRTER